LKQLVGLSSEWSPMPSAAIKRPLLSIGIVIGVTLYFALSPWIIRPIARALIGWDGCVVALLWLTYAQIVSPGGKETECRIVDLRRKGNRLLIFAVLASIASIAGLISDVRGSTARHGAAFAVALSVVTIVLSWFLIQTVFALRYAHEYFTALKSNQQNGGLNFVEPGEPDFWDFFHFSIVLGAASQTADIVFTSREMRRIGTVHTLVAFGFNTAILATLINVFLSALSGS
jgi:uncharacterized membrane protein